MPEARLIAIDGPIGVGKTTLARKFAQALKAVAVLERTNDGLLKDFYGQNPGSDVAIQFEFLYSRMDQQKEIKAHLSRGRSVVTDYTFPKNLIFAGLNLREEIRDVYLKYYNLFSPNAAKPDLVIFLQGSLPSILKRIRRRGRPFEKKIRQNYLQSVIDEYGKHLFSDPPDRLLIINTDDINVADVRGDVDDLVRVALDTPPGVNYYHPPGSLRDPDGR
ncbi:MAG TPA: deoxynucleoside kinase [Thermoanaerobaculia bacterium]|nr:deoxynucleoside kinase [Thermoanaerobaculia bacterium]HUM29407.1 deoxynucleoside kinase [Thermoanaerobaculia bacterium]HXK67653.1 deoxynucleoside kinase [Thermoanaerobaculia bacterium]